MKRTIHQVGKGISESSPPTIKRATSEGRIQTDNIQEIDGKPTNSFFLVHQNKELEKELKRRQAQLAELQEQSLYYDGQIVKIEEFLGFLDRVWNQFEADISNLLSSINVPTEACENDDMQLQEPREQLEGVGEEDVTEARITEVHQHNSSWSSLLQQYFEGTQTYFQSLPCRLSDELDIDEWSNDQEIEEAKLNALDNLDESSGLDAVKEEFANRFEYLKRNVEKLYVIINQQTGGQLVSVLAPFSEERNQRAEINLLRDQLTKLQHEILTNSAEMACLKRKLKKAEKQLLEQTLNPPPANSLPLLRSMSAQSLNGVHEKKDSTQGNAETQDAASVVDEIAKEHPLCQQEGVIIDSRLVIQEAVSRFQQQLQEAQQRVIVAERSLTDYMSNLPLHQSQVSNSAEISRLQKLLTEVRTVSNKRLAEVRAEKTILMNKVGDLEKGMVELVAKTETVIEQMSIACAEELAKEKAEKEKIQSAYIAAEADVKLMANMQTQVVEIQSLHDAAKSEVSKMTDRLKAQTATVSLLENNLASSKQREEALELIVRELADKERTKENSEANDTPTIAQPKGRGLLAVEEEEEGVIDESGTEPRSYEMVAKLWTNAQARCKDLERELSDAKANMDELIVEIESVATEEEKTRTQNLRLLKQVSEGHAVHKSVLQENLKLHQEIASINEKESLLTTKVENISAHMRSLEATAQQLRQVEQATRIELSTTTMAFSELRVMNEVQQKKIEELETKIEQIQKELEKHQQKLNEMKDRCNLLTEQSEEERTKRMELERLRDDDKKEREKESNRISHLLAKSAEADARSDQSAMLEMTLNMLRCSVCKDRFKQVAITKCFHLFCRECISENLKNRNRKCPACGEKFGQDDVKSVFFAH